MAEIDTHADLRSAGAGLVDWMEEARRRVVRAYRATFDDNVDEWPAGGVPGRSGDAHRPATLDVTVWHSGSAVRLPRNVPDRWSAMLDRIASGRFDQILVRLLGAGVGVPDDPFRGRRCEIGVELGVARTDASLLRLVVDPTPSSGQVPRELQDAVVRLISGGAQRFHAATGHITLDDVWELTAHELDRGYGNLGVDVREFVRGYQWATYVSSNHIAALGGRARVVAEAPVETVRDLSTGDHELLLLLLADDVADVTDRQLSDLKRYLSPVLAPAPDFQLPYVGPPIRAERDAESTTYGVGFPTFTSEQLGGAVAALVAAAEIPSDDRLRGFEAPPDYPIPVVVRPGAMANPIVFTLVAAGPIDAGARAGLEVVLSQARADPTIGSLHLGDAGYVWADDLQANAAEWTLDPALADPAALCGRLLEFLRPAVAAGPGAPWAEVILGRALAPDVMADLDRPRGDAARRAMGSFMGRLGFELPDD